MIAALAGVTGAATGFFAAPSTGLRPTVVPPEDLQTVNGWAALDRHRGEIAGRSSPGRSPRRPARMGARGRRGDVPGQRPAARGDRGAGARRTRPADVPRRPARGLGHFTSRTWLWSVVAAAGLSNLLWGAWSALGPCRRPRAGRRGGVGTVLGVPRRGRARRRDARRPRAAAPARALRGDRPLFAIPLAGLAAGVPVGPLALGDVRRGPGDDVGNTVWETTLQRHVPEEVAVARERLRLVRGPMAFYPIGLAIWGPIAHVAGVRTRCGPRSRCRRWSCSTARRPRRPAPPAVPWRWNAPLGPVGIGKEARKGIYAPVGRDEERRAAGEPIASEPGHARRLRPDQPARQWYQLPTTSLKALNLLSLRLDLRDMNLHDTSDELRTERRRGAAEGGADRAPARRPLERPERPRDGLDGQRIHAQHRPRAHQAREAAAPATTRTPARSRSSS